MQEGGVSNRAESIAVGWCWEEGWGLRGLSERKQGDEKLEMKGERSQTGHQRKAAEMCSCMIFEAVALKSKKSLS